MAKKIKLTESQLKKVMSVIKEDTYDQAIETHKREQSREVFMSNEDARLFSSLAHSWCQDKVSEPKCVELETICKKLKIDNT
jgi:hypothetical protein